jgi:hypothetical protein
MQKGVVVNSYADLGCLFYQFAWQSGFSRDGKKRGHAAAVSSRQSISIWRAMRRCAAAGGNPSPFDYPNFGGNPHRFLLDRNARRIRRAVRLGMPREILERRGLFDALRHHQAFRAFRKTMKMSPAQLSRTRQ